MTFEEEILQRSIFPLKIGTARGGIEGFGISKRELFAAIILEGFIARSTQASMQYRVETAVQYADALIAELKK